MIFSTNKGGLRGELTVPGDKSISHRSVMFGAISRGLTEIDGFLQGADCLSTIACFQHMGVSIENRGNRVLVHGNGMRGLKQPDGVLAATAELPPDCSLAFSPPSPSLSP